MESPKVEKVLKNFEDIPGPWSLPIIGTIYKYLPYIGEYKFSAITENAAKNYKKYGRLVREEIFPGINILYLFDPDHIETLLKASGKNPVRQSHGAILKYRKSKPNMYFNFGVLPTDGQEWYQVRNLFQKAISSPRSVSVYINLTNTVVDEFVDRINNKYVGIKKEDVTDFMDDLARFYLQIIEMIAFDVKMDVFSEEEMKPDSLSTKLMHKAMDVNGVIGFLDLLPNVLHTSFFPVYRNFYEGIMFIESVAVDFIRNKVKNLENNIYFDNEKEPSILESYLAEPGMKLNDLTAISVDLLLGGIDTTSFTTSFALYHLAKNPEVQQKLFEESILLIPHRNDVVDNDVIAKATYLKAFLKESLRVNPISIGIGRHTLQDFELDGYRIPKGTVVTTCNEVTCSLPEYVDNPKKFLPERWLKDSEHYKPFHPFLMIPFGHGARMCLAKRLAEQNMQITIFKLVRNFEMNWVGEDLRTESKNINVPAVPIKLTFKKRDD